MPPSRSPRSVPFSMLRSVPFPMPIDMGCVRSGGAGRRERLSLTNPCETALHVPIGPVWGAIPAEPLCWRVSAPRREILIDVPVPGC